MNFILHIHVSLLHAMNAAGRQAQYKKAGNTGMTAADLDTVPFLPEGRTEPAMDNKYW